MVTEAVDSGLLVRGLSYSFKSRRVLDNISFDLAPSTFCALLGPNGAGKSTLFALLTRLISARGGEIRVAGADLSLSPRAALAQMGVVFQQPTLDLDLTVRQNLRYFAALHGIAGREARTKIDAALDRLDMRGRADELSRTLNGGHRRRTEIARALIHDPRVLLLDEPTVGLDAESRAAITRHVHALSSDMGLTVLWATHLTDEVLPGDRLVILNRGQVLADSTAGQVSGARPLTDVFLEMTGADA